MRSKTPRVSRVVRCVVALGAASSLAAFAAASGGCKRTESSSTTTTTKKTDTPEGTKVTTEKHEKTVETKPK